MKYLKTTIFAVIFLMTILNIKAATIFNDSTEVVYKYWVQRGSIEMVYAFMQDYKSTIGNKFTNQEENGLKQYEKSFITNIDQKSPELIASDYDEVPGFLEKNGWTSTKKNLYDRLRNQFEGKKILDSVFFETKYAIIKNGKTDSALSTSISGNNNKLTNWKTTKGKILKEYHEQLGKLKTYDSENQDSVKSDSNKNPSIDSPHREESSGFSFYKLLLYLLIIGISFVLGVFYENYRTKKKIFHILHEEKDKYLVEKSSDLPDHIALVALLKKELRDNQKKGLGKAEGANWKESNEINRLKSENKNLNERIEDLEKENTRKTDSFNDSGKFKNDPSIVNNSATSSLPKEKYVMYFSVPEVDGSFLIDNGRNIFDDRKFYKIEYEENKSSGLLSFLPSKYDNRAINEYDTFLKPVCNIENVGSRSNANNIEIISPGVVVKIDNRWHIDPDKKVKIKFI